VVETSQKWSTLQKKKRLKHYLAKKKVNKMSKKIRSFRLNQVRHDFQNVGVAFSLDIKERMIELC
jgi:hypothetical protein